MIEHLSPSQISQFLRCGKQYEFRYIKGLKIPPAGVMVLGSAYHDGLAARFNHQKTYESFPDPELAITTFADTFERITRDRMLEEEDGEGYEFDEVAWEEEAGVLKDTGVGLLRTYQSTIAPHITPVLVEEPDALVIKTDEGIEIPIKTVIDLTTETRTVDHKVKKKAFSELELSQSLQATIYPMITELPLEFHVAKKTKVPQIEVQETHRVYADQLWFIDQAAKVWKAIQAGIFVPNNTGWHCDPRFCGYYARCQGGA